MTNRGQSFVIASIICLLLAFSQLWPAQTMTVWVFDVGQGDAIFIDGPDRQVLIDGGPDALVLERLSAVMPWWDRKIDIIVNTHPHADHLVGLLPVLERYQIDDVFDPDQGYNTSEFEEYTRLVGERRQTLIAGDEIDLGSGAKLTTLWPRSDYGGEFLEDPNDGSVVMVLTYGETSMLLTGDAGIAEEADWEAGDIDILKVGHHGSDTSTSQDLLDRMRPEVAIISLAHMNDYGHPSTFVIDRLLRAGVMILRTDKDGSIRIKIDPIAYTIRTRFF